MKTISFVSILIVLSQFAACVPYNSPYQRRLHVGSGRECGLNYQCRPGFTCVQGWCENLYHPKSADPFAIPPAK